MTTKFGSRTRRALAALGAAGATALGAGVAHGAVGAAALPSPAPSPTKMMCAATGSGSAPGAPVFDLEATAGRASFPDGNSIYMWSYANGTADAPFAAGAFRTPGPTLCVNQGDTVRVNLTNRLPEPTSIVFPGQTGVSATGGAAGLLATEAPAAGTVGYTFTAGEPGTYLYESGSDPAKQVQMGLHGALVVRPALGAAYAYNDPATRFDPNAEYLIQLAEIDWELHRAVERGEPYDVASSRPEYWTVNGRSFPDTIADNNVPWLPTQPQGTLVWIQPQEAANPDPALLRYVNAGRVGHPFHPHGNHTRVLGRDGRAIAGAGGADTELFTSVIGPGETMDATFVWTDLEHWQPGGNPVPVTIPGLQNLVFKDGATFYGGSPYLGQKDALPPKVTTFNQCGELYFPWHSHALFEFQNFNEGFGGMATLLRVDPPAGCPATP
ncbi:MAG: multicopper oxidase domain-containing protein [Actinomycetota bacterium]